ncbi:hypothetical protein QOZ80_3AG0232200 [Eleusine coracana subsp. coracana]|nr:hypothetical protein QOZ80_3AG0232200 [Eleusine coracana subsp. coracana]
MPTHVFYPSTMNPPALSVDDHATAHQEAWMLLELLPYIADRENATTARCDSWNGKEIQVTVCSRRPPCVSYLCVHSPRDDLAAEPEIIATDDDLILLRVTFGSPKDLLSHSNIKNIHYYVYQADDGDMGILRYDKEYIVAGIVADLHGSLFSLYLYDSGTGQGGEDYWTTHTVSLNHEHQQRYSSFDDDLGYYYFYHNTCKVLAIGGQDATMAFVDLWRGILFCDVRKLQQQAACHARDEAIPILSFVPTPSSIDKDKVPRGDARLWRNIAVVDGRLKYVELQLHWDPTLLSEGLYITDGWVAATFSRPTDISSSDNNGDSSWRQDCYIDTKKNNFRNDPLLKLLPKASSYDCRKPALPLERLHIRQPVLGLQEGADIIFFTAKVGRLSENAWVVALDIRNKALVGVAAFSAARIVGIDFAYIQSRTSKYVKWDLQSIG